MKLNPVICLDKVKGNFFLCIVCVMLIKLNCRKRMQEYPSKDKVSTSTAVRVTFEIVESSDGVNTLPEKCFCENPRCPNRPYSKKTY